MALSESLIDRIYEAAFVPEFWPSVLTDAATAANAASGELQIIAGGGDPIWKATERTHDTLETFMKGGQWRQCERPLRFMEANHAGFLLDADIMTPDQIERDPVTSLFGALGLGWQLGSLIPMPTGEIVGLTFERLLDSGPPDARDVSVLDGLRPHLARSTLVAARLRLDRATATVSTLEAIGLPAAIMSARGRLLAANGLFEAKNDMFLAAAFEGLTLKDVEANRLFQDVVKARLGKDGQMVQSIPIRRSEGAGPAALHLLPLRRAAHDILSGGDMLLVANEFRPDAGVPSARLLTALFDLTPSEARLTSLISAGSSVNKAAVEMGISLSTARTYLARVFEKTSTNQQSQLVALVKSARQIGT